MHIEPWVEHAFVERVDGFGVFLWNMAVAHALTHHAGILLSAKALSLLWRERDLVCSMRNFSSNLATFRLMYSLPLSE